MGISAACEATRQRRADSGEKQENGPPCGVAIPDSQAPASPRMRPSRTLGGPWHARWPLPRPLAAGTNSLTGVDLDAVMLSPPVALTAGTRSLTGVDRRSQRREPAHAPFSRPPCFGRPPKSCLHQPGSDTSPGLFRQHSAKSVPPAPAHAAAWLNLGCLRAIFPPRKAPRQRADSGSDF